MNKLLRFFSYHQPRRIRVIENTLRSRRTVATLFWARQYGILEWLGADRTMNRQEYDQLINQLVADKLLTVDDQSQASLTEEGAKVLKNEEVSSYIPSFYDWYWLANTQRVMQRLFLAIQVVSEFAHHQRKYVPLAIPYSEMVAVKQWFRQNYHHHLIKSLYTDLHRFGTALASEDPRMTTDLFNVLIGYQQSGWTINQAAQNLKIKNDDIQYLRHDEMLAVSAYARNFRGPLQQLLLPLINESPLNRSAQVTFDLYTQGVSIGLIAQERRLKENTIKEHLLEAAILIPDKLDWDTLLPESKRDKLSQCYKGEPTTWQFDEQIASFYEYRLYQIFQGITNEK
ncbi:helix-turn-helix domain-containing protein [Limosilactobacillus agrestis]|uniref:Helix-turn-helix domain-containing protein n=1 Tax=Limosilactobacillus agrestis TaxID=2759748 RepID=A0ABS8R8D3_9LACO|nr:hypothetical protein [Lactobacillus sp.]MCD7131066.1 helix-turn-helix domain-containing protein [Limosilactobacillus agrestis]